MLLEDYLTHVLYDPEQGYYAQSKVIGQNADFITAPEISPLFSLCIAQWIVDQWHNAGCPIPVNLVELGAGHGTMLSCVLKTLDQIPNLSRNLATYVLDTSEYLKIRQSENLKPYSITWIDHLDDIRQGYTIILANEFFDALPIQYYRSGAILTVDQKQLVWTDTDDFPQKEGISYTSRLYDKFTQDISKLLHRNSGIGLIIDYGSMNPGFTLQAVKNHQKIGLFDSIGQADLTHHVDFRYLIDLFHQHNIKILGPIPQGQFLKELGIEDRVHALHNSPTYKNQLLAVHRLTAPQEMGDLFKVLAIQGGTYD